jgi:hypothetical protein
MFRNVNEIVWLPRGFEFLSGLPESKRKRRKIMAYQTYIDDSGGKGQGKILMLGGLFGSAEALAAIADKWEMELRANLPLPIRYFKASEANSLSGEFNYWYPDRRDQKVRRLASVVDRDDVVMVYGGVDLEAHRLMESQVGGGRVEGTNKHPLNQPYLLALLTVMLAVGREMWYRQTDEKIEVIFDNHDTFRDDAKAQYKVLRDVVPKWLLTFLPLEPLFRDDKDFVVLQAADLLMGDARMHVEKTPDWTQIEWKKLLVSPFSKYYWAKPLSQLTVKQLARRFDVPEEAFNITLVPPHRDEP